MKPKIMLHDGEKVLFEEKPSERYFKILFFSRVWHSIYTCIILAIAISWGYYKMIGDNPNIILYGIILAIVLFIVSTLLTYFISRASMNRHWYFLTNQRIILYSGFISISKKYIPYSRVADVNITQDLFHRLFGLSRVRVDETMAAAISASGLGGVNYIEGLTAEDADKFAHFVSQHMTTQ